MLLVSVRPIDPRRAGTPRQRLRGVRPQDRRRRAFHSEFHVLLLLCLCVGDSMPDNFGARLRQHRERRGIDLSAVAAQTKIKTSLLEELERGDVSHWPTGIFRRSFIRAYALAIQLEPDPIVREFLERFPDPNEEVAPLEALADAAGVPGGAPPTRFRFIVHSAIGSLARRRNGSNGASSSEHNGTLGISGAAPTSPRADIPVDRRLPAQASDLCDADL